MANIAVELLGLKFRNPVIPAAGPNVGSGDQLQLAAEGGAGGLLAKTVSVNKAIVPRPNMHRYGPSGLLNAELWSELPLEQWLLREYPAGIEAAREHGIPFLASVGYSSAELRQVGPKVEAAGVDALEFTVHYLEPQQIVATAQALRRSVAVPIIAKLSPHSGDLGNLAAALEPHVDGFSCINSFGPTLAIDIERCEPVLGSEFGYGWISGGPIKPLALRCVFEVARRVSKPVIGIGGVSTATDVIEMFMAGASLVAICTVVLLKGNEIYGVIARGVSDWLDKHGFADIGEIQGLYVKKYGRGQRLITEFEESPRVIPEKCNGCAMCGRVCRYEAIWSPRKTVPKVDTESCQQCGLCVSCCPCHALEFRPRDLVTLIRRQEGTEQPAAGTVAE